MARIALIVGLAAAGAVTGGLAWAGALGFGIGGASIFPAIMGGLALGGSAGNLLGQLFFPTTQRAQPPLNDLQAMSSAPGQPIPWGYGSYRIAGQLIWAQNLKPIAWQESSGGKGGGNSSTTYGYVFTGAISFGYGPGSITRIWGDSKLIYDVTSKTPIALDAGFTHHNGSEVTSPFIPTIYPGTSTQNPDPTMQAALGIGSTPAFRDQIYIVVENMPLGDFGNRIPNFRAEVTSGTIESFVKDLYPGTDLPAFTGTFPGGQVYPPGAAFVDSLHRVALIADVPGQNFERVQLDDTAGATLLPWQGDTVYVLGMEILDSNGNVQLVIRNHTSGSPSFPPTWQTGEGDITQVGGTNTWFCMGPGPTGITIQTQGPLKAPFYTATEGSQNVDPVNSCGMDTAGYLWACGALINGPSLQFNMIKYDPNTFAMIGRIPIVTGFRVASCTFVKSQNTGTNYLYCTTSEDNLFLVINADTVTIEAQGTYLSAATAGQAVRSPANIAVNPNTGVAYVLSYDNTTSPYTTWVNVIDPRSGIIVPQSFALPTAQCVSNQFGEVCFVDPNDASLLVWACAPTDHTYAGADLWKFDSSTFALLANTTGGPINDANNYADKFSRAYNAFSPSSGMLKLPRVPISGVTGFAYINTSTMTVDHTVAITEWMVAGFSAFDCAAFDALSDSLVFTDSTGPYAGTGVRIFFDRQAVASAFASDIITDLWLKAGASTDQLDVSQISDVQVLGYPLTQTTTGRAAITPLAAAFFFDMVETDNKLVAVPRGQSVTTIIPESDLGISTEQYKLTPTIQQENDLPKTVYINFSNPALDYQQDKQQYQRNARVKKTKNESTISLPIVMEADTAVQIAAKALTMTWMEKNSFDFKLWKAVYLTMDPSDVIQFTYNGNPYQARVVKINAGQDSILELSTVSEDPRTYASGAVAATNPNFNTGAITATGPSALFILDTPFVSDSDNNTAGNTGYYYLMGSPASGQAWPGGTLFISTDNKTWFNPTATDSTGCTFGYVIDATPAPANLFVWDFVTTITVHLTQGQLSGTSMENVLNGANIFYMGGEQMAFVNATLNADGSVTLDTLLRGLRGTEWACGTHVASETFLLLNNATFREMAPTSLIDTVQYFRGITIGNLVSSATSQIVSLQGNDLKPYAPANFIGSGPGGVGPGDIVMSWVRRTRVGGAWLDGTGTVPLSEEIESYDLDICPVWNTDNIMSFTVSPAAPFRTVLVSGMPTYYDTIISPFTITWEDGVTASYPGYDFLANATGFACVNDPTRAGGSGASYTMSNDPLGANTPGNWYLGFYFNNGTDPAIIANGGREGAIRTVSALATPTYTYPVVQQEIDFPKTPLAPQPFVRARVFQNSASVGRGFATDNNKIGLSVYKTGDAPAT